jgi:hypothetical protein
MILDFSGDCGIQYSLKCINQSTTSWYFYIYQRAPGQSDNDIYSLVWMTSPYKIGLLSFITFKWSVDYSFFWLNTGKMEAGIVPYSGGYTPASLSTANSTTFDIKDDTPQLSGSVQGPSPEEFSIIQSGNVPNAIFSTGIGMSGFTTFIQQSYANTSQAFRSDASIYIAAATQPMQAMQVISQGSIPNSIAITFPLNICDLTAILGEDNLWTVSVT